jgi:hypothetical protein
MLFLVFLIAILTNESKAMNFDNNGLIVQLDGDGGDTAGREGDYWFFVGTKGYVAHRKLDFKDVLNLLQSSPGVMIRNPVGYNQPDDFSRDQQTAIILAAGEMKERAFLRQLLWQQIKRFGAYQNFSIRWSQYLPDNDNRYTKILGRLWIRGDYPDPQILSQYIRAMRAWYLYPLLLVGDMSTFVNSIIRCIVGRDPTNTSNDINHTLVLLQAQNIYATPISWVSRLIYKWFIPGGVQSRWDNYFNVKTGANAFNEMYRPLISNM